MSGIINTPRAPYSTRDWVVVKTYEPRETTFGPLPPIEAQSYVAARGGEEAGFFIVEPKMK